MEEMILMEVGVLVQALALALVQVLVGVQVLALLVLVHLVIVRHLDLSIETIIHSNSLELLLLLVQ
jgi:hypothetical protein